MSLKCISLYLLCCWLFGHVQELENKSKLFIEFPVVCVCVLYLIANDFSVMY